MRSLPQLGSKTKCPGLTLTSRFVRDRSFKVYFEICIGGQEMPFQDHVIHLKYYIKGPTSSELIDTQELKMVMYAKGTN